MRKKRRTSTAKEISAKSRTAGKTQADAISTVQ